MGWGNLSWMLAALLAALLLSAGIEDARRREIANWKNAAIALAAPVWWWWSGMGWAAVGWQLGLAFGVFVLFALAFRFGWMGGGDVKLIAALALWLPGDALLAMLMLMSVLGGVLTLVMMFDHWRTRSSGMVETPYGVAIAMAALLTLGEPLLNHFA